MLATFVGLLRVKGHFEQLINVGIEVFLSDFGRHFRVSGQRNVGARESGLEMERSSEGGREEREVGKWESKEQISSVWSGTSHTTHCLGCESCSLPAHVEGVHVQCGCKLEGGRGQAWEGLVIEMVVMATNIGGNFLLSSVGNRLTVAL